MSHDMFGVHIHIPISRADADAHGLDHQLGQLIVEAPDCENAAHHRLAFSLAAFFEHELEIALLVMGPFESADVTNRRLGTHPVASLGGMNLYQCSRSAIPMDAILAIEAEELAVFGCPVARLHDYIARVEQAEPKWWQPSSMTLRGALMTAPDLVDPVAFYASSRRSIEILGTPAAIKRCAERAWSL